MADYIIRNVPAPLWAAFKARLASEGRTGIFVIHRLIEEYVAHGLRPVPESESVGASR